MGYFRKILMLSKQTYQDTYYINRYILRRFHTNDFRWQKYVKKYH